MKSKLNSNLGLIFKMDIKILKAGKNERFNQILIAFNVSKANLLIGSVHNFFAVSLFNKHTKSNR